MKTNPISIGVFLGVMTAFGIAFAADTKISALPAGSALGGTEAIPAVQSGSTVATTPTAITTYAKSQLEFVGTSGSIGGGVLLAGACASGTVSLTGATTSMVAVASPITYPGDGNFWSAQVTSANTITVRVCAAVAGTPTSSTYNVRVLQ